MSTTKADIRKERLAIRDAIPQELRIEKCIAIADHGKAELKFEPGTVVSGFMPIRSEADIRPLMWHLRNQGARLCLPVVLDRETIVFRALEADTEMVQTGFGTTGPGEDAEVMDPDIMLVPLSAFDKNGTRIGYGGGYYDRAIERLHKKGRNPRLIGVAFDAQRVEKVPAEPHDISLDAMLTESGLEIFENNAGPMRVENDKAATAQE